MNTKIICLTPTKNEGWILDKFLACASLWADHIIISDQSSTDDTIEIARRCEKTIVIHNPSKDFDEVSMRQGLLDEARKIVCDKRIIIYLDADEILSANFQDSAEWETIQNAAPGIFFKAQCINIYPSIDHYFSPKMDFLIGFVDDNQSNFYGPSLHGWRLPYTHIKPYIILRDIKFLHFPYLNVARFTSKNNLYQCLQKIQIKMPIINILRRYNIDTKLNVKSHPLPKEWIDGYKNRGIDVSSESVSSEFYWWDYQVLELFERYGTQYFDKLDIWHTDWTAVAKSKNMPYKQHKRSFVGKLLHTYERRTAEQSKNFIIRKVDNFLRVVIG